MIESLTFLISFRNQVFKEHSPMRGHQLSYQRQKEMDLGESTKSKADNQLFFQHSYRDVSRKKFHFCLSFSSVFLVVWSALVINTIVKKGPIIFLKLAEGEEGQYDGIVYPTKQFDGLDSYDNTEGIFINYTKVDQIAGDQFNLAPRKQFCGARVGSDNPITLRSIYDEEYLDELESNFREFAPGVSLPDHEEMSNKVIQYNYQACVMFWDTE